MLNKILKLFFSISIFAIAVWQFSQENIGNGISLVLLSALIILFYFKNENILLAFFHLRKQNLEKAMKYLNKIKTPEKTLVKRQQAYYYYLMGLIESQSGKSMTISEKFLKKALKLGLKMKHDRAMATLNLANIAAVKRRKREALNLITETKKLDTSKMLSEQIRMLQNQLKRI